MKKNIPGHRQLFQYHSIIGWNFIPGLKARVNHESGGYLVRVNKTGFRSEYEYEMKKSTNKFRIMVFGDSFTAADGISNKFRYSDILEKLLPNVEVYNFGLPGSGTDQHYLIFREIASKFDYDLIIIGAQVENIRRVASRYRPYVNKTGQNLIMAKPYFSLDANGSLELSNCPVPKGPIHPDQLPKDQQKYVDRGGNLYSIRKTINKLGRPTKDLIQKITKYQPLPDYDDSNNPNWLLMQAIFKKWTAESKTKIVIFPIPVYHYIEKTSSSEACRERFKELNFLPNIHVHDPLSDLLKYTEDDRRGFRFNKDIHPTPALHKALAISLESAIKPIISYIK